MKVLTGALIKKSEENAVQSGIFSFRQLMGIAGAAVAERIDAKFKAREKRIAVVCGNGNNGGDGFVAAAQLCLKGGSVSVILPLGMPRTEDASHYFSLLDKRKINICEQLTGEFDVIVDALFGIGLNRPLDRKICKLIEDINQKNALRVSIDIPSGVCCDDGRVMGAAVTADYTVTFTALKPGLLLPDGSDFCGETEVVNIGFEAAGHDYLTIEKPVLPKRRHNSHKGTFGTALLICGSYGMAGAAVLAARAALRSGAGIVKAVVCDSIYSPFTCAVPEAVCLPRRTGIFGSLCSDDDTIIEALGDCSAVLVGCGLGNNADTQELVKRIAKHVEKPVVIDADGINALCGSINIIREIRAPVIITPHPGEMARLCGVKTCEIENNRIAYSRDFARDNGCIVVLKGANTIVALPHGGIFFNTCGNPGMATGGSGDVLSGMLVSLLAQGLAPEEAAKAAVYLHGEAGDRAAARRSQRAMLAGDIIEELNF